MTFIRFIRFILPLTATFQAFDLLRTVFIPLPQYSAPEQIAKMLVTLFCWWAFEKVSK